MYIATRELRDEFINGLAVNFSYARRLPTMQIGSVSDISFGATHLFLAGTPFSRQHRMTNAPAIASALEPLCLKIWNYFYMDKAPSSQAEFDLFHKECCHMFLDIFASHGYHHNYGNAQKFVNVLFKYLSCYSDAFMFEKKFQFCHMALDGFTYAGGYRLCYYRDVVCEERRTNQHLTSWSKLTESEYDEIANKLATHVAKRPKTYNTYLRFCHSLGLFTRVELLKNDYVLTIFEAEFFIWTIAKNMQSEDANGNYIYTIPFVRNVCNLLK